jgi:hypothetical protein
MCLFYGGNFLRKLFLTQPIIKVAVAAEPRARTKLRRATSHLDGVLRQKRVYD